MSGVLEVTAFDVRAGEQSAFERCFKGALPILMRQHGYLDHDFGAAVEQPERYWLLVRWETLEAHTKEFRDSPDFEKFTASFRPLLANLATVSHFKPA